MISYRKIYIVLFLLNVSIVVLAASTTTFKFALVTDTHIGSLDNNEDLIRTVEDINSISEISFVIVSGDVTEFGSFEELKRAKDILDNLKVPYYSIPGNHDANWSESGTNDFLRVFGNETFGFEYNGYKFIGLASGPNMRMSPGQIPRENLTWFFDELENTSKETPIIYINHYPMDEGLNNWFEVMDALRPYNVKLMLCGHGHTNRAMNFEGVNAAMCRSNLRAGKEYGGYNIITVDSDSIYFQERIVTKETNTPWLAYSLSQKPNWVDNPPRPDYTINTNHPYSTPYVYNDLVWCASSDTYLYGINKDNGKEIFKLKNNKAVVSSPVCTDDKVILSGGDGYCRAWNVFSGEKVWEFDSVKNFVVTRPAVNDGILFFGSWGNEFYALNVENGKPKWIWNNGHTNRMLSPAQVYPVITNGRVYLASPDRFMTVLDEKTGEVIWRYNDPDNRVRESIGVSEDGATVYAKTMDGNIIAIDATLPERRIKWVSSGENMGYELAPTALVEKDGVVYAPTDKGNIYAFAASDGKFLWKYRISNGLINMILPTDNRELYVSAMDGRLVKLRISR